MQNKIHQFQQKEHARCIVCGAQRDEGGLGVIFEGLQDGSVQAIFDCAKYYTGYEGRLHGGVIATLLDGAMTNCLAGQGHIAVTAELKVRYKKPVLVDTPVKVRAFVEKVTPWICFMKSEIIQMGKVCATAKAKFIEQQDLSCEKGEMA